MSGPRASHLPSTTFCWLPPLRFSALCSGPEATIPSRSICSRAMASSRERTSQPMGVRTTFLRLAMVTFSRTFMPSTSPSSRRFSGT